jgi:uncharacterized membrane protein YhaH (DUF805 family)
MRCLTPEFRVRAKDIFATFLIFPTFVLITAIPWLLAIHANLLSRQFHDAGRNHLATAFNIIAISIAVLTAMSTVWCFVVWIVFLARYSMGARGRG